MFLVRREAKTSHIRVFLPGGESNIYVFLVRTSSSGEGSYQSRCFGFSKTIRDLCVMVVPICYHTSVVADMGTGHISSLYLRVFEFWCYVEPVGLHQEMVPLWRSNLCTTPKLGWGKNLNQCYLPDNIVTKPHIYRTFKTLFN